MNTATFIKNLEIDNSFIEECIRKYITRHNELYGNIISERMLLNRLNENIRYVKINESTALDADYSCSYEGFDQRILSIDVNKDNMHDSVYLKGIEKEIIRQLTDASYRERDYGSFGAEHQMFGTYEKLSDGSILLISGHDVLRKPFIDHITDKILSLPAEDCSPAALQIGFLENQLGSHIVMESAWFSDESKFKSLFNSYSAPNAYLSFCDSIQKISISDNIASFDKIYSSFDFNAANEITKMYSPFWTERRYRKFLENGMDESEFVKRLQQAFENEAKLHPDYRESIFRGENEALVRLVATEYAYDLSFRAVEEQRIERDIVQPVDSEAEEEETVADSDEEIRSFSDEETETFIQSIEAEREEAIEAEEKKAKKAALDKKRARETAERNARYNEQYQLEQKRIDAARIIEEQRKQAEASYISGFAISEYSKPDYLKYEYESQNYSANYTENQKVDSVHYNDISYESPEYKNEANDYYYPHEISSSQYDSVDYASDSYHKYEQAQQSNYDDIYTSSQNEIKERLRAEQEQRNKEYYERMEKIENYQSKNIDGHFSFDSNYRNSETQQPDYESPDYSQQNYTDVQGIQYQSNNDNISHQEPYNPSDISYDNPYENAEPKYGTDQFDRYDSYQETEPAKYDKPDYIPYSYDNEQRNQYQPSDDHVSYQGSHNSSDISYDNSYENVDPKYGTDQFDRYDSYQKTEPIKYETPDYSFKGYVNEQRNQYQPNDDHVSYQGSHNSSDISYDNRYEDVNPKYGSDSFERYSSYQETELRKYENPDYSSKGYDNEQHNQYQSSDNHISHQEPYNISNTSYDNSYENAEPKYGSNQFDRYDSNQEIKSTKYEYQKSIHSDESIENLIDKQSTNVHDSVQIDSAPYKYEQQSDNRPDANKPYDFESSDYNSLNTPVYGPQNIDVNDHNIRLEYNSRLPNAPVNNFVSSDNNQDYEHDGESENQQNFNQNRKQNEQQDNQHDNKHDRQHNDELDNQQEDQQETQQNFNQNRRQRNYEEKHNSIDNSNIDHNKSAKDSTASEESSTKRAKEHFQKLGENAMRATNRVRYVSNVTGYTTFIVKTNQMVKNFVDAEIRNSDDVGETFYTINSTRRKTAAAKGILVDPFMNKIDRVSSTTRFIKADVHRNKIALNRTGASSKELKKMYSGLFQESNSRFNHVLKSKKAQRSFLESCGVFDFSNPKLKQEISQLTSLKKRGQLTDIQAKRLQAIQSGISVSQINPRIKVLLEKKKEGAFTINEMVELEKLISAKEVVNNGGRFRSLKSMIGSSFILATDSARKSDDMGLHGLVKVIDFSENPYTRASIKAALKFTRSNLRLGGKVLKGTSNLLLNHTAPGKIVKEAGLAVEKSTREFAKKQIKSLADSTAGRFSKKALDLSKKVLGKIRSPFGGKVSNVLKKGFNVITWPMRKLKQMVNAIQSLIAKIGMILGGFFITMFLFIIILDVAGAAFSIIFEETDKNNKVNLSPYIEVLEKKNSEFVEEVKDYDPGGRYDRVYTNLTMEDNTKEILSMMAVRFEQDLVEYHTKNEVRNGKCDNCINNRTEVRCKGHRDDAFEYIEALYDASHEISVSESLLYSCGKTVNCTRRESYTKYVSFSGMSASELNNIDTSKYERIYRDAKGVPLGGDKLYYRCPGDHLNATISSSVLHFDEIFYIDSNGGSYGQMGAQPLSKGESITIPSGLGKLHTYMGWSTVTARTSKQYKLREASGEKYDNEGFARIGDRYVIACTSTFGQVGDYVDFYQSDGSVIKGIIGDIKNQTDAGCNKWGHMNGQVIVEFVVNYNKWYKNGAGSHANPGTKTCHPAWNKALTKCVNRGNYWSKSLASSSGGSGTTEAQKKVASYAAKNISTFPTTLNYCAAWVTGVYEAAGMGSPGGNARDFWFKWKSTGSSSPENIPVGAVVVGSGVGSLGAIYGHVGIYIGDNKVAENIGRHNITTLDNWIASNRQYNASLGKRGFVGWVWPGKVLGSGTDGSYGTTGYLGASIWDDDHIEWAKLIYEQDWKEMYTGFKDISLDWSGSGIKISTQKERNIKDVMDEINGSPYVYGGVGPNSFDCSGLVYYVFEKSGVYKFSGRPTCTSLAKMCIPIKEENARFGDLVIWSDSGGPYHVAIYCGGGMIFEASNPKNGVRYYKVHTKDQAKFYRLPTQH